MNEVVILPLPSELCPHFPNPSFPGPPGSERRSPANEGVRVAAWALFRSEHPRALRHPNPGGSGASARLALNRNHSVRAIHARAGPEQLSPTGAHCPQLVWEHHQGTWKFFWTATLPPRDLSDSPTLFPSAAQHRLSGTRQSARKWHNPFTQSASERPSNLHCECEQRRGGDTLAGGDDKGEGGLLATCGFLALTPSASTRPTP